jgi:hypothetical protein
MHLRIFGLGHLFILGEENVLDFLQWLFIFECFNFTLFNCNENAGYMYGEAFSGTKG